MGEEGQTYDLVIVGSGAGAICAALVAKAAGRSVVILEKEDKIGGSTALSGGVLWVPDNPVMKRGGMADSLADARTYLDACAGEVAPGSTRARREVFLREGPRAIAFLERLGMQFLAPSTYSDYHEGELPGARPGGRSLIAPPYDLRKLGPYADRLRRLPPAAEVPVSIPDVAKLSISGRGWGSKLAYLRVGWRMFLNRLGWKIVGMGGALQGRLLRIALDRDIPILTEAAVEGFLTEGGRVTGVKVRQENRSVEIRATRGVLVNSGGFSRNAAMRDAYQQAPTSLQWTYANPGDTGEMIEAMKALGGTTSRMELSVWVTTSILPDGVPVFTLTDMSKPHAMLVDQGGRRYVNEATSYVRVGLAMYARDRETPTIPSWIIFDSQHRRKYFFASQSAGKIPAAWRDSGFLIEAATIEELAHKCDIPPEALKATVERLNDFAREGVDRDFGRGRGKFDNFFGDPTMPNPNLGTIEEGPFFAVRAVPGDVGTYGGIVADERARVLQEDGTPIPGLYATGNATAPVTGPSYPGAGASIAAAMVFGYVAAHDALGLND